MALACVRNLAQASSRTLRAAVLVVVAVALTACSTAQRAADSTMTTFIVVRHAEKGIDDPKDPSLSEAGRMRAQSLARLLVDASLTAAYATGYRRTQQTAQPAADVHGIKVTAYDAQLPASAFASQLRTAHAHGTVLVVGHSNTAPEIVAALSGQPVDAMSDDQYDLVYRVCIGSDGKATLTRDRY